MTGTEKWSSKNDWDREMEQYKNDWDSEME